LSSVTQCCLEQLATTLSTSSETTHSHSTCKVEDVTRRDLTSSTTQILAHSHNRTKLLMMKLIARVDFITHTDHSPQHSTIGNMQITILKTSFTATLNVTFNNMKGHLQQHRKRAQAEPNRRQTTTRKPISTTNTNRKAQPKPQRKFTHSH